MKYTVRIWNPATFKGEPIYTHTISDDEMIGAAIQAQEWATREGIGEIVIVTGDNAADVATHRVTLTVAYPDGSTYEDPAEYFVPITVV